MASGGCSDAFKALRRCVAAAVKDGSGTTTTPPTTTTQPLPCLDAADSLRKCMENADKYAHIRDDLIASGANNANRRLVLEFMETQEAAAEMELPSRGQYCMACFRHSMTSGSCKDTFLALDECVEATAAAAAKKDDGSGMTTTTTLPLPCLEAAASLKKCMEEHTDEYFWILDHIAAVAGEGEADAGEGEADASDMSSLVAILREADARVPR